MATVIELERRGDLSKVDPGLSRRRQEFRLLYASVRLVRWFDDVLPNLGSSWNIELTPQEQIASLIEDYASGEPLMYGPTFKSIHHVSGGIWELKTADLRLFGWFTSKDVFIGHICDDADRIKTIGLYHGYAGDVARYRDTLDLNEPKFVPGADPNAVLSNFSYP